MRYCRSKALQLCYNLCITFCFFWQCNANVQARIWSRMVVLQPLRLRCVECVIHHERDVHEEQQYIYVPRTSTGRVIMTCELYCCLLPQCEALRTCRSGFSNRNSGKMLLQLSQGLFYFYKIRQPNLIQDSYKMLCNIICFLSFFSKRFQWHWGGFANFQVETLGKKAKSSDIQLFETRRANKK